MAVRKKTTTRRTTRRAAPKARNIIPEIDLEISPEISREIFVIFWGALAVLTVLIIGDNLGMVGGYLRNFLFLAFGWGTFVLPVLFAALALAKALNRELKFTATRIVGLVLIVWPLLGMIHLLTDFDSGQAGQMAAAGQYGGYLGFALSTVLRRFLGDTGAFVVMLAMFLAGIPMVFGKSFLHFFHMIFGESDGEVRVQKPKKLARKEEENVLDLTTKITKKDPEQKSLFEIKMGDEPKTVKKKGEIPTPIFDPQLDEEWQSPSLDLLADNREKITFDDMALRASADKIKEKLQNFGIGVEMREAHIGPTVIQYTLKPDDDVKLSKIKGLQDDLALALAAKSIRIEAPIPGKSLVGIELPAEKRTNVFMREILESDAFSEIQSNLRLVLGRDVTGKPMVTDLKKMPHLLIAGQTGAGKSVGINVMLLSLLYQNSPNDLKMIMVDPKRVELSMYDGIPHLLTPVISDPEKVVHALKWAVAEMTRRLRILEEDHCRNIDEYNSQNFDNRLPYIVIVIDELADLMMTAGKEVDALVCRLAQLARAVGMHLIIATQRPSVNVITGTIKANIPSRLAYTVMSQIDSRTILDQSGAEKLMGRGDSLFFPTGAPAPVRAQSAFVSTKEVEKVVAQLKLAGPADYQAEILEKKHEVEVPGLPDKSVFDSADDDPVIAEAIEVICETGKASASLLQRRLSVGYARAARILDILEEKGVIGPAKGAKPRDIYL